MKALSSNQPSLADELRSLRLRCAQFEQRMDELRRMLLELGQERDQLRQLYDSVPVACMTLDASGGAARRQRARGCAARHGARVPVGLKLANAIAVPQHVGPPAHSPRRSDARRRQPPLRALAAKARGTCPVRLESAALRARTPGGPERCRTVISSALPRTRPHGRPGVQSVPGPRERHDSEPEMMLGSPVPSRGATVLVVEDESLVRKAVQHYLVGRRLPRADGE